MRGLGVCLSSIEHVSVSCVLYRVMFCGLLFLGGNVLKKALAKLFSSHFYKATHYDKMQDALRKVRCCKYVHYTCLHSMCQACLTMMYLLTSSVR